MKLKSMMKNVFNITLCLIGLLLVGCELKPLESTDQKPSTPSVEVPFAELDLVSAKTQYDAMCSNCHGSDGSGGLGGSLINCKTCTSFDNLTHKIDQTMPTGAANTCTEACAKNIAGYILNGFTTNTPIQKTQYTTKTLPETLQKFATTVINRQPTTAELELAKTEQGFDQAVRNMMTEFEYGEWLKITFNDLLLTNKFIGNGSSLIDAKNYGNHSGLAGSISPYLQENIYFDSRCYNTLINWSYAQEPLELIRYVALNNKHINEIITAKYRMVNYYTQRDKISGLKLDGSPFSTSDFKYVKFNAEEMKTFFCNEYKYPAAKITSEDDLYYYDFNDYQPAIIPKVVNGATSINPAKLTYSVNADAPLPLAGVLTSEMFLERYPTNTGNKNRLRAAKVLKFFLDIDIGASQVDTINSGDYENPVLEDPNCTGCHNVLDPVASSFRNWLDDGLYWPEREAFDYTGTIHEQRQQKKYFDDNFWNQNGMLPPGFDGQSVPKGEDPLQLSLIHI